MALIRCSRIVLLIAVLGAPTIASPRFCAPAMAVVRYPGASDDRMPSTLGNRPRISPGRLLLRLKPGVDADRFLRDRGLRRIERLDPIDAEVVTVPAGREPETARRLSADPTVVYAEPDGAAYAFGIPNDPLFAYYQWYLQMIRLPDAWDMATGTSDVVIAILDTGADSNHPDLKAKLLPGYDALSRGTNTTDDDGHGSHVSGLAAASSNNGIGIAGVSWGARVMPVRVLNAAGEGSNSQVADGVLWAVDHGARIINLSLGSSYYNSAIGDAVRYAKNKNRLLVAAAGNEYLDGDPVLYPASLPGVMAVGASTYDDRRASYSETGNYISVVAPGGDPIGSTDPDRRHWITSTWRTGQGTDYQTRAGTSQASPLVSGLAAVLWSIRPDYTADQIRSVIESTAVDLGARGRDSETGYGRIDARAAVASLVAPPDTTAPVVSIRFPAAGAFVSGVVSIQGSVSDSTLASYQVQYGAGSLLGSWLNVGTAASRPVTQGEIASWDTRLIADGPCMIRVVASNAAGNTTTSGVVPVTVDNTPPAVQLFSSDAGGVTRGDVVLLGSVIDSNLASYTIDFGTGDAPQEWTNLVSAQSAPIPGQPLGIFSPNDRGPGTYTIRLLATDRAGNNAVTTLTLRYQPAMPGDANADGRIDVLDAIALMRMSIGILPAADLSIADVAPVPGTNGRRYGDGKITIADAVRVLKRALNLEPDPWP